VRIIHRYILREITTPFALGLASVTLILLVARLLKLVELIVNRGVPFLQVAKLFSYILPAFLEVTVPMALLLAILVAFGRLSSDSELTALKASGISLYQLIPPVAAMSSLMTSVCLVLSLYLRPWANDMLRTGLFDIARTKASAGIRARVFNDDFAGLVIYVDQIDQPGNRLRGILIADSRNGKQRDTVLARLGILVSDEQAQQVNLRLYDGQVHSHYQSDGSYHRTEFADYDISLSIADAAARVALRDREPSEMPWSELTKIAGEKWATGASSHTEDVEMHRRMSIPFACLAFASIAIPLGIRPSRSFRSRGVAMSLGVVLTYYLLLTSGQSLGERGIIDPLIAMWSPNVIVAVVGLSMLQKAARQTTTEDTTTWIVVARRVIRTTIAHILKRLRARQR